MGVGIDVFADLPLGDVDGASVPDAAWLDHADPTDGSRPRTYVRDVIDRVAGEQHFVSVRSGSDVHGSARGVTDGSIVGLFDLHVDPSIRRSGLGTRLIAAVGTWGADAGAAHCWLQVEEANLTARRIYDRLGFTVAYEYCYGISPGR